MRITLSVLLAMAFLSQPAAAQKPAAKPLEFKGFAIGKPTTPEEITEQLRIHCGPRVDAGVYCFGPGTIGEVNGRVAVSLGADLAVNKIVVTFDPAGFEGVLLALVDKHGNPGRMAEPVLQNRMGAKYQSIEAKWSKPGRTYINATKYAGSLDTASVEFGVVTAQKAEDSIKRKAKDL